MKTFAIPLAASFIAFAGAAAAQTTVVVTPEQETVIREYIVTQEPAPIEAPADVTIEVGSTLPDTIELQAIDAPDLELEYRYVVVDGRTVLVEPQTREIVYIVE